MEATAGIRAQAFRELELSDASSLGDDAPEVRDAADAMPAARRLVLEAADWSWASRVTQLARLAPASAPVTDPRLPHAYALPADCIALREVLTDAAWRRDGFHVVSDTDGGLAVRYTAESPDDEIMPATARRACALLLASLLAPKWLPTRTKIETLERKAQLALQQAVTADARMQSPAAWIDGAVPWDWSEEAVW